MNTVGLILMYDVTNMASFDFVINYLNTNTINYRSTFLIANKVDLSEDRVVSKEKGSDLAKRYTF